MLKLQLSTITGFIEFHQQIERTKIRRLICS